MLITFRPPGPCKTCPFQPRCYSILRDMLELKCDYNAFMEVETIINAYMLETWLDGPLQKVAIMERIGTAIESIPVAMASWTRKTSKLVKSNVTRLRLHALIDIDHIALLYRQCTDIKTVAALLSSAGLAIFAVSVFLWVALHGS